MPSIVIIYSTIGGSTELVVDKVIDQLKESTKISKKRVDICTPEDIQGVDVVVFASPTYGQGTVESHFQSFLKSISKENLNGKKFAVIGLGDIKYYPEYLTESSSILTEFLQEREANIVCNPLRISGNPLKVINSLVPKWADKLLNSL